MIGQAIGRYVRARRPRVLGLEVAEVEALCADLSAAGMTERAREQWLAR